jgi:4-amino-4-deoxy-L-arabinose transferase-like glycosyltransferase
MHNQPETQTDQTWLASPWVKWGGILLFILWLFFGLSAYYVAQRPISPTQIAMLRETADTWVRFPFSFMAVTRSLLDILAALWLCWVALGVGLWLLAWLKVAPASGLETALYALGLGFGSLGVVVLLLGLVGWVNTAVYLILLILLTAVTARKTVQFLRQAVRPERPPKWLVLYLFIATGLALFAALLPPTSWDALSYHLKAPQIYLAAGRILPAPDTPNIAPIYFPSLFEMLFMLAMGLRGDVAAQLLHFFFSFFLAGLVFVVARDQVKVQNPWLAVLFYYTIPMVLALAGHAYNDLSLAFFQLAALLALFQWQRFGQRSWLILCGLLCGFAMGHKYTSFVLPLTLALLVAWDFRPRIWEGIRPLLFIALPAALAAAPFYLKNLLLTGNPVYPFVFGGMGWDDYLSLAYADPGSGIGWNLLALLRLPYDLTIGIKDVSGDGQMGPFFLVFLPLILLYSFTRLGRGATRPFRQLLFYSLLLYLFWTLGVINSAGLFQGRQLFTMFVVLCPVLAWLTEDLARWDHPQFSLRRFILLVVGVALAINLLGQTADWLLRAPHTYVIGSDSREETLARLLGPHYEAMAGMNTAVPPGSTITFLWEPRSYYCQHTCLPDILLFKFSHLEHLHGDAASIAQAWRTAGITHVLIFEAGLNFATANEMTWIAPQDEQVLADLRADWLGPVRTWEGNYTLYALK